MARTGSKGVYIAALLLFLGGLGWLVFTGLSEDSVYFLNVSEALAMDDAELGNARLFGKVAANDLEYADGGRGADFQLIDKTQDGRSLRVSYRGALPDTFKPGVEVIVEGSFTGADHAFVAKSLVTKCPSKYREKSDAMEETQS